MDDDPVGVGLVALPAQEQAEPVVPTTTWPREEADAESQDMAMARMVLIELWRYLETGEAPAGAELVKTKKGELVSQAS